MHRLLSFASLTLGISIASAAIIPRDSSACSGFPNGSLSSYSFSLAALNTTLPNANTTGAPLVLGSAGAVDGALYYALGTQSSYQYYDYSVLYLSNGGITAGEHVWSYGVSNNTSPGFIATLAGDPNPALVYCAVTELGYDYPILAAAGHADLFSVCQAFEGENAFRVYYNATATESDEPVLDTCYPVVLQMTPP